MLISNIFHLYYIILSRNYFKILSKPIEYNVANDIENLHEAIEEMRISIYGIVEEEGKTLHDYGDNLLVESINTLYVTSTSDLLNMWYYVDIAKNNSINIDTCNVRETEDKLRLIPTEVTDELTICMRNAMNKLSLIVYNTFAKVQIFEDTVNEIEDELKNCNNDDCLNKIKEQIDSKVADLPNVHETILNFFRTSVNNIKIDFDDCSDNIAKAAINTMNDMTNDAIKCITSLLPETKH